MQVRHYHQFPERERYNASASLTKSDHTLKKDVLRIKTNGILASWLALRCLGTSNLGKANSGERCRRMSLAAMLEGSAPRDFCLIVLSLRQTRSASVHSRLHDDENFVLDSDRCGRLRWVRAGST